MNHHIAEFISAQTVMTIATVDAGLPHCAMCFYVFMEDSNTIVFKSKPTTQHVQQAKQNNQVAGTILPDKLNPGKTSGIQFTGIFRETSDELHDPASKAYYRKYPFAAVVPGEIWTIELTSVVFTDAMLGFGKKRTWERNVVVTA
ncbi:MAG TPA: pyridoxamine 5'-phosphate oxidase family protein [Chitinophagaceae bacterium]